MRKRDRIRETEGSVESDDGIELIDDGDEQENSTRARILRAASNERRKRRRGPSASERTKTSIWTTVACRKSTERSFTCEICSKTISVGRGSSTNIISHFKAHHFNLYQRVQQAQNLNDKQRLMTGAVMNDKKNRSILQSFVSVPRRNVLPTDVCRRVAGIVLKASRQLSFDDIGSPEMQLFVDLAGGMWEEELSTSLGCEIM